MFDAKSLLEMLVRGGTTQNAPDVQGQSRGAGGGGGGLEEILRQLLGGANSQTPPASGGAGSTAGGPGGIGSLEDLLRQVTGSSSTGTARAAAPSADAPASAPSQAPSNSGNVLEDILRQLTGGQATGQAGSSGGGFMDILGQVLGQATAGAKEGAQRIDGATGASGQLRDILARTTGKTPEELLTSAKELFEQNKFGAGAAAGGAGAVILGTQTGRSLAGGVIKIGALALIGGLAYKALQNYQSGKPVFGGAEPQTQALLEAPSGSGYEARAVTNDAALLYIRAMIAAAAADGRIDDKEMDRVIGGLKQAGVDGEAEAFIAAELNNPATTRELADGVHNEAEAVQVFTAARIAIDLDDEQEHTFLARLADDLGIDRELAAHIDATARQAA